MFLDLVDTNSLEHLMTSKSTIKNLVNLFANSASRTEIDNKQNWMTTNGT